MLAFVTLAEQTSFARAADKLFLSQPALSTAIKNLESQLGGKLLNRNTRQIALTPEGQAFFPVAKRLLNDWNSAIDDVTALFSMQKGQLVVAAMPSFAESMLPQYLHSYHVKYPNVRIRVLDIVMEDIIHQIEEGRAELGFVFEPEQQQRVNFTPILQDTFAVVVKQGHPLAGRKSLALSDISDYPHVSMNKGSTLRLWIDRAYASMAFEPKIIAEANQLGTLGQMVNFATQASELAVAVVPQLCSKQMQSKGLMCIPLVESQLIRSVGAVTAKNSSLSAAAQAMMDIVCANS